MKHSSFQRRSQFTHHLMPGDLWIKRMWVLHTPWSLILTKRLPTAPTPPPKGEKHSFEGISPLWPSLPGKARKLFLFYVPQTLVSVFLCCASEQRLGFCSTINWTHGVLPTQWFWGAWAVRYKRQIQFFLSGNSPCMAFPAVPPSHHILPGNFSAVMTKWVIKSSCYFPFQFI